MRPTHQNGVVARRSTKALVRKTGAKLATLKALPRKTGRFVKSNPVGVILGLAVLGFVVAKLKSIV